MAITTPESAAFFTDSPSSIIYFLFQLILTLWVLVVSGLSWMVIRTTRHLHSPFMRYFGSLVIVNYIQGAVVLPLAMINDAILWRWTYGQFFCEFWQAVSYVCHWLGPWSILAMTVDRLLYHSKSRWYAANGNQLGKYILVILWLGGLALNLTVYMTTGYSSHIFLSKLKLYHCQSRYESKGFVYYTFLIGFLCPLLVAMVMNIILVLKVRKALLFEVRPVSQGAQAIPLDSFHRNQSQIADTCPYNEDTTSFSLRFDSTTPYRTDSRQEPQSGFFNSPRSTGLTSPKSSLSIMSNSTIDLPYHLAGKMSVASMRSSLSLTEKVWYKPGVIVMETRDCGPEDFVRQLPPDETPRFQLPKVTIPTMKYMRPTPILYPEPETDGIYNKNPILAPIPENKIQVGHCVAIQENFPMHLSVYKGDDEAPSRDSGIDSPEVDRKTGVCFHGDDDFYDNQDDMPDVDGFFASLNQNEDDIYPDHTDFINHNRNNDYEINETGINTNETSNETGNGQNESEGYAKFSSRKLSSSRLTHGEDVPQSERANSVTENISQTQSQNPLSCEFENDEDIQRCDSPTNRPITALDMEIPEDETDDLTHADYALLKRLGLVILPYIVLWFPYFAMSAHLADCKDCDIYYLTYSFLEFAGHLNTAINPFIYLMFMSDFKAALKRIIRCQSPNVGRKTSEMNSSVCSNIEPYDFSEERESTTVEDRDTSGMENDSSAQIENFQKEDDVQISEV